MRGIFTEKWPIFPKSICFSGPKTKNRNITMSRDKANYSPGAKSGILRYICFVCFSARAQSCPSAGLSFRSVSFVSFVSYVRRVRSVCLQSVVVRSVRFFHLWTAVSTGSFPSGFSAVSGCSVGSVTSVFSAVSGPFCQVFQVVSGGSGCSARSHFSALLCGFRCVMHVRVFLLIQVCFGLSFGLHARQFGQIFPVSLVNILAGVCRDAGWQQPSPASCRSRFSASLFIPICRAIKNEGLAFCKAFIVVSYYHFSDYIFYIFFPSG